MNRRMQLCAVALLALLGACGSNPKMQYYTLTEGEQAGPATLPSLGYAVVVGPVFVPDIVDRPQFVLRMTGSEVRIAEQARWAEPLKLAIGRVVAVNVANALGNARVSSQAQGGPGEADYRVVIDVQRFDSAPGQLATLEMAWTLRSVKDGQQQTGRVRAEEPVAGQGYQELAAAHARALAQVSRGIADAIRSLQQRDVAKASAAAGR
jgi:uncharacterized lipoprotein YmbA